LGAPSVVGFLVIISRNASLGVAMGEPTFRTNTAAYPRKVYSASDTKTYRETVPVRELDAAGEY